MTEAANIEIRYSDGFYELIQDGMTIVGFPARWQLIEFIGQTEWAHEIEVFDTTEGRVL